MSTLTQHTINCMHKIDDLKEEEEEEEEEEVVAVTWCPCAL